MVAFWEVVCSYDRAVHILSVAIFTLVILTVITFPALEPGTPAHALALINLGYSAVFIAGLAVFYVKCDMGRDAP